MENFGDPKGAEQPFLGIAYAQPSGNFYWYKPSPKKREYLPLSFNLLTLHLIFNINHFRSSIL